MFSRVGTWRAGSVLLLAVALAGCTSSKEKKGHDEHDHAAEGDAGTSVTNRLDIPEEVRRNLGITFAKVEMRRVSSTLRMPGRFELIPSARREYHAPLAGKVELQVRQYDKVTTGQPLYRLDSPDWRKLQQDIADAEAQVRSTSASLVQSQIALKGGGTASAVAARRARAEERHVESLRLTFTAAEARVAQLEKLQAAIGGKLTELSEAKAKVAEARTALTQSEEEAADLQREALKLTTEGGGAFAATASLEAGFDARRAEHEAASVRLKIARASAASVLGVETGQLDTSVEISGGTTEPLWRALDHIDIRASASGVVQTIEATNGAYVESTKPVLAVADPAQVRFRAVGLQSDLERLRDGMPAQIVPPSGGGSGTRIGDIHEELPGTLNLGQEADPDQRSLDLVITPSAQVHWARPGVAAYAEAVLDETEEPATAIPVAAIMQDDLNKIFFRRDTANPDKVIRVEADLGISDGQWAAVESGLKAGDEVVLGGVYQLKLAGGGKASKAGHFHADGTFHEGKD